MVGVEPVAIDSTADLGARAVARVRRRLIPFLALLYFVAYLDRVNVGFAALQMNRALGLSPLDFGRGAGIFFLGYFLFEVPSSLALARVAARTWVARIAVVWGLVSMAMVLAAGPASFALLRFLLGAAEAGFFPGVVLYFTYWFPARERARALGQFYTASMASGIIGSPLSGLLLQLRGVAGLDGWQWLFLAEGLPAVILGCVALAFLGDGPRDAGWLPAAEKAWLIGALDAERGQASHGGATVRAGLWTRQVWVLSAVMFLIVTSGYGFSFFLPQIVKGLSGASDMRVAMFTAVPFLVAAVGIVLVAAHSDRTGGARLHVAGGGALAAAGLAVSATVGSPVGAFVALAVAAIGLYAFIPPFWSLPTAFLRGDGAAAGIGLINSVGNLGGFAGPYVMGWMQGLFGDFRVGLRMLAASALCSALVVLTVRRTSTDKPM